MMLAIFIFSATPGSEMPSFGSADYSVKKGGHMLGYGLLALSYRHGLNGVEARARKAWFLTILYAALDELHQAFVPGRHPSVFDAMVFDATGAAIALWIRNRSFFPK